MAARGQPELFRDPGFFLFAWSRTLPTLPRAPHGQRILEVIVRHTGVVVAHELRGLDAADRRVTSVEREKHQLGIGHLQDHVHFSLALNHRPGMRMKRKLDPVLECALADLIQILREDLAIRAAEVLRTETPAEIGLERRDPEIGRELGVRAVAVKGRLQLGGVEILPATCNRGNPDPGLVEHSLEDLRRLREIFLHFVAPRLNAMKPELCRHLDAGFRVRLQGGEHVSVDGPAELVCWQSVYIAPRARHRNWRQVRR